MLYYFIAVFLFCLSFFPSGLSECQLGEGGSCVCSINANTYREGQQYFSYVDISDINTQEGADIVFIVDESKSMSKEHRWLLEVAPELNKQLKQAGIGNRPDTPNRFGLTTFGAKNAARSAGKIISVGNDNSQMGNPEDLKRAIESLVLTGRIEDGYQGIKAALTGYQFRPDTNIAKQFILVTDENRDIVDRDLTISSILQDLQNANITLNAVVKQSFEYEGQKAFGLASSEVYLQGNDDDFRREDGGVAVEGGGDGSTYDDYVKLALMTNGASWDIELLRKGGPIALSFTKAFIAIKLREIIRQIRSCRRCICTRDGPDVCDTYEVDTQQDCIIPSVPTPQPTSQPNLRNLEPTVVSEEECRINGKRLTRNEAERRYVIKRNGTNGSNGYPTADVVFVVDESGSMIEEHQWLKETIDKLDKALQKEGIGAAVPNRYGLVGFATTPNINGFVHPLGAEPQELGSSEQFAEAVSLLATAGRIEDGYRAITTAVNAFRFRTGRVARQIILVTDEDRDDSENGNGTHITRGDMQTLLKDNGFRINVIVNQGMQDSSGNSVVGINTKNIGYKVDVTAPNGYSSIQNARFVEDSGHGSTMDDYVMLATNTSGAAWDLNQLRRGGVFATAFTNSFVDAKVKEIADQLKVCQHCTCTGTPLDLQCSDVPNVTDADTCYRPHVCKVGNVYINDNDEHCGYFIFEDINSNGTKHAAADVLIVVDESRSMVGEQEWLKFVIPELEEALKAKSVGKIVPNKYGLIGFANDDDGRQDKLGTVIMLGENEQHAMGSAEHIRNAIVKNVLRQSGRLEDGYSAIMRGLESQTFRRDTAKLIILITDEDRDVLVNISNNSMYQALVNSKASLNVVVNQGFHSGGAVALGIDNSSMAYFLDETTGRQPDRKYKTKENGEPLQDTAYGTTDSDYTRLALMTGGAAWDLNRLRKGGQIGDAFTKAFVAVKVEEALSQLETCRVCRCEGGNLSCKSFNLSKADCSVYCSIRLGNRNTQLGEKVPDNLLEQVVPLEEVRRAVRAEVLPSSLEICHGDIPLVTCKGLALNDDDKVKLQWTHNGQPVPSRRLSNDKQKPAKELKVKVKTAEDAGEYVCTATVNPQYRAVATATVNVSETCLNTCGKFFGKGYARVLRGRSAQRHIEISMKICPNIVNSGILYCFEGTRPQSCSQCLVLSDGFLELRWPCCLSEPAQVFQQHGVAPNQCHTIRFITTDTEAILELNGDREVLSLSNTCWNEFQPSRPVHLGGRRSTGGYDGCMSDIRVDTKRVFFSRDDLPRRERVLVAKRKRGMMRCTSDCSL